MSVKFKPFATIIILFLFALYFLYQQSASLNIQMTVTSKSGTITTDGTTDIKQTIKEGDILYSNDYCRISFELDKDAYVYILYLNSTGTLKQLYPSPRAIRPQKVLAKTTYVIPPGDDSWFQLDEQTGTETVLMAAAEEPLTNIKELLISLHGSTREEVLKTLQSKTPVVKILNFKHL